MKRKKCIAVSLCSFAAFVLWTLAVSRCHVLPIGPLGSPVGFAGLNSLFHDLTGVNLWLYHLTDMLSLIPALFILGFTSLGILQWIRRKSPLKADPSILALGGIYLLTFSCYVFFEYCVINYRPVLIEGIPEASYPSSTTVFVICVMGTAALELKQRITDRRLRRWMWFMTHTFTVLMVVGRTLSGVHWLTDIIGGILLSAGLVTLYAAFVTRP